MTYDPQPERSKYAALGRWLVSRIYADATPITCSRCRRTCLHLEQKNPRLCYACDLEEEIQRRGGYMRILYDEWENSHPWADAKAKAKAWKYYRVRIQAEGDGWKFESESFQAYCARMPRKAPAGSRGRSSPGPGF